MTSFNKSCPQTQDIASIRQITLTGALINIGLSALKFVFGALGHSQAVIADAVHSLSDLSTDISILLGVRIWTKQPDDEHPYGHRRVETLIALFIGIVLMIVGILIGYHAFKTVRLPDTVQPNWLAFIGAVLSIAVKEVLYRRTLHVGEKQHSPAVIANAWHHRSDALSSLPVAIAVAMAACDRRFLYLDHIGAIVVSLFIVHAAWRIVKPACLEIIDTGANEQYRNNIATIALMTDGVKSLHALRTRRMGSGWYIDLHIQVDPTLTVDEGHAISEAVRHNLLNRGTSVMDVVVHLEPFH